MEAITACSISQHNNIITTYGYFIHQNSGYLVMELMKQDLLDASAMFTCEEQIQNIFTQICKAVAYLHNQNIAHLDIKLENILVDEQGNGYLCDFGAAHYFKELLKYKVGTVFYSAPETRNYLNNFDKAAADVWSLGIVLYVLLTDVYPYAGTTEEEVLRSIERGNISFSALQNASCSNEAKLLVTKMLNPNPANRPTVCQVLRDSFCFVL